MITWHERMQVLRFKLGRNPNLDEMLAEAKVHKMTPEEIQEQRVSWVRAMMPTGDPRSVTPTYFWKW